MPLAACVGDMHTCPMVTGVVPHVGGPILPPGAPTVIIAGRPAATGGDTIFVNASYVRDHPDDLGMMIHEFTHVIQAYPGQRQDLGWLTEGIADYIRHALFEKDIDQLKLLPDRRGGD